jgi:ABC-2 type transport system permease protein
VTALKNVAYLVQKEWRQYFASPIAYVALTFWAVLVGLFYCLNLNEFINRATMMAMRGGYMKPSINDWIIAGTLYNMAVVGLFVTPMITMRLLAEEKRQGTIELLATSPITDLQIVLGKFFGALALYTVMLLVGVANLALMWHYTEAGARPDWRPLLTGILGILLVGGCCIAVGLFASALTRNQIIAGVVAFAILLVFWMLSAFGEGAGTLVELASYLGLISHVRDLVRGIVDLKDIVYYLSFITFALFLTHQVLESHRWRA